MSLKLAQLLDWQDDADAPQDAQTFESVRLGFLVLPEPMDLTAGYQVRVITPFQSPLASAKGVSYEREHVAWGDVPRVMVELRAAVESELDAHNAKRAKKRRGRS